MAVATVESHTENVESWPLSRLRPNPLNPRGPVDPSSVEELAASIRIQGVLQPLLILADGTIVAGHRRHAAAMAAGRYQVPVIVRDLSASEQLEIMIAENVQRADLTPIQEARAYRALLDQGRTQADIIRQVGVSGPRIAQRLAILRLEAGVQELFDRGELPLHCSELLARIAEPHQQSRLALLVARRRITVDRLREMVNAGDGLAVLSKRAPAKALRAAPPAEETSEPSSLATRSSALALMEADPARGFTFGAMRDLFDPICGLCADCGMSRLEDVCRECPLPKLVCRLAEL